MSYAVMKDKSSWRAVDGAEPKPETEGWECPNYEFEDFSEVEPETVIPTHVALLSMAMHERDRLLSIAAIRVAPLQDAVDGETATKSDISNLKLWKEYRVSVNRVSDQPGFPGEIDWPEAPST